MKFQRYSLPEDREPVRALQVGWPLLLILAAPPLAGYLLCGMRDGRWGVGVMGLVIAGGFTYVVWHGLVTGVTENRSVYYRRDERPFRYWSTLMIWFACYLLTVSVLFIGHKLPSPGQDGQPAAAPANPR